MVDRTLADPEAVPLLGVAGARERAYATATTIAREQAIARSRGVPGRPPRRRRRCRAEAAAGGRGPGRGAASAVPSPPASARRWRAILTSGRGVELVVGVAGSGKTTALAAARDAFEAAGYEVVGTSTSGQAARTLGREAGIDPSRTLASLNWRIAPRHACSCRPATWPCSTRRP